VNRRIGGTTNAPSIFQLEYYEQIMENNGKIMSIFVACQKNSVTKNIAKSEHKISKK
jgi:hypothetical protein